MDATKYDVGYVGWWDSQNYGSALTAFALNRTLKQLGKTVLMIPHPGMRPGVQTDASYGVQFARHFCDCAPITGDRDHRKYNELCDVFVTGSDQLWNWWNIKDTGTEFFFLDFVNNDRKKIAYATSFGMNHTAFPENWRLRVGYFLSRFDAISVREKSGVAICKRDFHAEATHVMDPVFMCGREAYEEVISLSRCQAPEEYVFAYILDPTEDKLRMVRMAAEKLGLPYRIAIDGLGQTEAIKEILQNDPDILTGLRIEDWLYYLANSSFVTTDSFHGFCYSLIFHKPSIAYINERRGKARFESIAEITGLEERMITDSQDILDRGLLDKAVDFTVIDERLDDKIRFSRAWLERALDARKLAPSVNELLLWKCIEHDRMLYSMDDAQRQKDIGALQERATLLEASVRQLQQELEEERAKHGRLKRLLKRLVRRST